MDFNIIEVVKSGKFPTHTNDGTEVIYKLKVSILFTSEQYVYDCPECADKYKNLVIDYIKEDKKQGNCYHCGKSI